MEEESSKSPGARLRFGFSGKRKRAKEAGSVSKGDILESLTRQASSQVGFGKEQEKGFEVLVDDEPTLTYGETITTVDPPKFSTKRNLGRFAFVLMLLGSMLVVFLYTSGMRLIDAPSLNRLVQNIGLHSIFTNPGQISVISFIALIAALWVAQRRKNSRIRLPI